MWIAWGNMRAGKVEACDGSAVVTDFFHVCFLPIWPRRSWVLPERLGPFEDPDYCVERVTPLPRLHARSVWLGIARTWFFVFAIGGALSFLVRATSDEIVGNSMMMNGACVPIRLSDVWMEDSGTLFAGGLAIVLGALGAALLGIGRLGALGRAQRRVYALVTGLPVDPIHLAPPEGLRESVIDAANSLMAHGGYRTTRQPEHDWPALALDPSITDCMLVARAFVLSRALQASATPGRAAELRDAHASLWDRLQTLASQQGWRAPDEHASARAAELKAQREARPRSALLAMLFTLGMVLVIALAHFFADGAN